MLTELIRDLGRYRVGLPALTVALSGTAFAASLPRNRVRPTQRKKHAVNSKLERTAVTFRAGRWTGGIENGRLV